MRPIVSGRSQSWLKSKCGMEQEFVIIGWRPSDKAGRPFRSLLLALREDGELRYAGRVGSGYSGERLDDLAAQFKKLERKGAPVPDVPPAIARACAFPRAEARRADRVSRLDPRQPGAAGFVQGTAHRQACVRDRQGACHAEGQGGETREGGGEEDGAEAAEPPRRKVSKAHGDDEAEFAGVRVTHPDRVLFEAQGVTKRDLIDYYLSVADLILPHVARPAARRWCAARRAAAASASSRSTPRRAFPTSSATSGSRRSPATREYMTIEDERGLVAAVQVGVLELHIWGSHADTLEKPDRWCSTSIPTKGCRSRTCATRRRTCASG